MPRTLTGPIEVLVTRVRRQDNSLGFDSTNKLSRFYEVFQTQGRYFLIYAAYAPATERRNSSSVARDLASKASRCIATDIRGPNGRVNVATRNGLLKRRSATEVRPFIVRTLVA